MNKILVVEDDRNLNQIVCRYLNDHGYDARGCLCANDAYDAMYNNMYDLIISDIMMPGIDGYEFAQTLRELNSQLPILFMSARDDIESKEKGFRAGIDDYMVKPIQMDELRWRIAALLRRANIMETKRLSIGKLTLDAVEMSAVYGEEELPITVREFNIMYKLLSYPKRTFSRAQLMDEFWGVESETSLRSVDVYIKKLRDKFAVCKEFEIKTVHGLGYKVILNEKA